MAGDGDLTPMNAMTVDVEDYFQVSAFDQIIGRAAWDRWPSRVERNTDALLALFAERGARATFFTLGWVAERHPALVRRIAAAGHEIGCHGYQHIRVAEQAPAEFAEDIRRAKALLEDAAGTAVIGYRAASFSIGAGTLWALPELARAGFRYSSSIYPVSHDHYGMPQAPRYPFRPANAPDLLEIPVSTARFGGRNWPAAGGGYFRLYPYALSRTLLRSITAGEAQRANFYFHPWEIDPDQPRPDGLSAKTRFRHYVNLSRMLRRLGRLLHDFRWASMREVYAADMDHSRAA